MDPAWIAVAGTAIGAAGAAGAAAIAGWSARRQASAQSISQHDQWLFEKRVDVYSAFLDAGVQARDDLTAIWRLLKTPSQDVAAIRTHLESAESLIKSVSRASAEAFSISPDSILKPTRQAEENIVLFHAVLRAAIEDLEDGRNIKDRLLMCARQQVYVRDILDRFSASARTVLNGGGPEDGSLKEHPLAPAEEELMWIVKTIAEKLQLDGDDIDAKRPLFETGLDSLGLLECSAKAIEEFDLPSDESWPISSLLSADSIEEVAYYIAKLRRTQHAP